MATKISLIVTSQGAQKKQKKPCCLQPALWHQVFVLLSGTASDAKHKAAQRRQWVIRVRP